MKRRSRARPTLPLVEFVDQVGWPLAEQVAIAAGIGRPYLSQIAHGHKRPKYEVAEHLVAAAERLTPCRLDLHQLMTSKVRRHAPRAKRRRERRLMIYADLYPHAAEGRGHE